MQLQQQRRTMKGAGEGVFFTGSGVVGVDKSAIWGESGHEIPSFHCAQSKHSDTIVRGSDFHSIISLTGLLRFR